MPGLFSILPPGVPGSWSIYKADGAIAVPFDTFMACTVKVEAKAAHDPVEKGSFADYNKVVSPTQVGVILARTGTTAELSAVLEALDALVAGTDLVSVVTPEKEFMDYSLTSYDYDRKNENGVDRLVVNLVLEEIRQVEAEYSNEQIPPTKSPKQPGDSATKQAGKQAPQQADTATKERTWKKYDGQIARRLN